MSSKTKLSASDQKKFIEQLQQLTHATHADATRIMKATKYNINLAVEAFFGDMAAQANAAAASRSSGSSAREQKLKAVFEEYKDAKEKDLITIETIADYFEAIGITDMDSDIAVYLISFELKSPALGTLPLSGWCEGWAALKVDSIAGMASQVPALRKKFVSEPEYFKKVYKYVFDLGKAEGAKVVAREMAVGLWQTLLPPVFASKPSALVYSTPSGASGLGSKEFGWWIEFLEEKSVKGVSKDLWNLFIEFAAKVPNSYDVYDEDGAWPSLLDEFFDYAKQRRKKEGGMDLS